jgi:hypothetical protein
MSDDRPLEIPEYIRVGEERWALSGTMTVAMWRQALAVAEQPIRDRSLRRHIKAQWRAAHEVLRLAAERGLGDDATALEALGFESP